MASSSEALRGLSGLPSSLQPHAGEKRCSCSPSEKVRALSDIPNVRALMRADLPMLIKILERTSLFPSELLEEMAEPFLSGEAPHLWLVAEQYTVIGFAYAEPERITEGTFNLLAIAVDPELQGAGVGKALVSALLLELSKRKARLLLVETSSLDQFAGTRAFYAGQAFVEEARIRDFYCDGDDKVVFWKRV